MIDSLCLADTRVVLILESLQYFIFSLEILVFPDIDIAMNAKLKDKRQQADRQDRDKYVRTRIMQSQWQVEWVNPMESQMNKIMRFFAFKVIPDISLSNKCANKNEDKNPISFHE